LEGDAVSEGLIWSGFIGQSIAASTKNLRRVGIALLSIAVILGLVGARKLSNVIRGPAQFDENQLAALSGEAIPSRDYATVRGTDAESTEITAIEKTTRDGAVVSQTTTAEFMALMVGTRILIVKAKPGVKAVTYTGAIVPLPVDVKREFFADLNDPSLQAATFPVMLDASQDYGEDLVLGGIAGGLLFLLGLWALIISKARSERPEMHPLCKALSQHGSLYTVISQIDSEAGTAAARLGDATFTPNWVICCSLTRSLAMNRQEIIWIYKKRTKHSVNFIPTGTTYAFIIRDARGKSLEISTTQKYVDSYLTSLAEQTPWVIFGYDRKLEKLYNKQRAAFIQTVAERKAAMLGAGT
jgi:hypothetical protein